MSFVTSWLFRISICAVVFVFLFFNNSLYWDLAPPLRAALASNASDRSQQLPVVPKRDRQSLRATRISAHTETIDRSQWDNREGGTNNIGTYAIFR
jgi:hypothetical protein